LSNTLLQPFFYGFACFSLFLLGWQTKGTPPGIGKYVLIAAPHSSNWDFVFFLLTIFKHKMPVYWMAKNTMFRWPFTRLLQRLGGIPVDRSRKANFVHIMADAFERSKQLALTIAPSGTREKVIKWKTGFYHIALQANVPIVCGFIDYPNKTVGIGPTFHPTGDMDADMGFIKAFYTPFSGKYTQNSE
jgi:1-acyl-sn-glycerol-3-phosphate acyltransferase